MDLHLALSGFVLGLAIAAPVGAIGTLVIRTSLVNGFLSGLSTGLGAAVADAVYAGLGALGVAASGSRLMGWLPFRMASALMMLYLARSAFRPKSERAAEWAPPPSPGRAFLTTIALTLANPSTIASFAAASASIGIGGGAPSAAGFALAVFTGSATWWVGLSAATSSFGPRLGPHGLRVIDWTSGTLTVLFAWRVLFR
jgi:threonine/homoserine/homoserine lactone efflux protein